MTEPLTWGDPPHIEWREQDGELWEYRTEVLAVVECPRCGEDRDMEAETDEWQQGDDGRWHHTDYGPALAECCGLLLMDGYDGVEVYHLSGTAHGRLKVAPESDG